MKKVFIFAAIAALFASCSEEQLATQNVQANADDNTVNFSVYTPRSTRAGIAGDITNANIMDASTDAGKAGFGVFAYYTPTNQYDAKATPNFMYNQQVTYKDGEWKYEPVKYWPNEYGDAAKSDDVDRVSFFAYAPYVEFLPTEGKPDATGIDDAKALENYQKKNIIETKKNSETGDPIIKYVVDTDPASSVDLLWGVNADPTTYAPIGNNTVTQNKAGLPFIDLVKPANPLPGTDQNGNRIKFNLRHALAKVKVTIDYIADAFTPAGPSEKIDAEQTRIFVRNITMSGFAMEGALNLNNTEPNVPLWKDFDGKDLAFDPIQFNDGRKDAKEGTVGGDQKNEPNQYLNKDIIENGVKGAVADGKFTDVKKPGVTNVPVLLFGGDERENGGFFYVIPRNGSEESVNVEIVYDVETIDPKLAVKLSDLETRGSSIENIISKKAIFGEGVDFEAGKQYEIKIHLGMTSVKIDAIVEDWVDAGNSVDVDLPDNQDVLSQSSVLNLKVGDQFNYTSYADENASTPSWGAGVATVTGFTFVNLATGASQEVTEIYAVPTSGFGGKFYVKTPATLPGENDILPIYTSLDDVKSNNPAAYVKLSQLLFKVGDIIAYHAYGDDQKTQDCGAGKAKIVEIGEEKVTVEITEAFDNSFVGKQYTIAKSAYANIGKDALNEVFFGDATAPAFYVVLEALNPKAQQADALAEGDNLNFTAFNDAEGEELLTTGTAKVTEVTADHVVVKVKTIANTSETAQALVDATFQLPADTKDGAKKVAVEVVIGTAQKTIYVDIAKAQ